MSIRKMQYRFFSFLGYLLFSRHKKGHGIHSPFVYKFISEVLWDKTLLPELEEIETIRKTLLQSDGFVSMDDFGTGGAGNVQRREAISRIAATASTRPKYGRLLYRIVRYFKPGRILELGTSFGFGSMYLGMGNPDAEIITLDGCKACSSIAAGNFRELGFDNITVRIGLFETLLPEVLRGLNGIDLVYFDGDHRKDQLVLNFETVVAFTGDESIFIFDDIHWSTEMRKAWEQIKKHPKVKVTMDLFQVGIVFFRKGLQKQDFLVRFL